MNEPTQSPESSSKREFEQGPIRPPSEARSLLVRVTRNCHWNRCTFCPVYKGTRFSVRPVEDVLADLDAVAIHVESLSRMSAGTPDLFEASLREHLRSLPPDEQLSFRAALLWFVAGMESVFLQDADALAVKPPRLLRILTHLHARFPSVKRVTAYGRSDTIDRIAPDDLRALREAGLDRVHVGMESGCDRVLERVHKKVTREEHVRAGLKVKAAGMELSVYYMPGLGGRDLYRENAVETAEAVSRINPHFVRLRTLALPDRAPLAQEAREGRFSACGDVLTAQEIRLFLEGLDGCDGYLANDHVLNLLPEVEGWLSRDRERMVGVADRFLALDPDRRALFQLGRRLGFLATLADLDDPTRMAQVVGAAQELGATRENVDEIVETAIKRYI